jgi:hypothetical protein
MNKLVTITFLFMNKLVTITFLINLMINHLVLNGR